MIESYSRHLFHIINAMVKEGNCVLVLLPVWSLYLASQSLYLDLLSGVITRMKKISWVLVLGL